jgi:putative sterol carrier protein
MTSAEECRAALQKLASRLSELPPNEREQYFGNRTISVTIPDLNVTYVTLLGSGDDPVREAAPGDPPADIRMTANSDEVAALAEQPMNIARAWMSGRVKIEASMKDLFRLRRLL